MGTNEFFFSSASRKRFSNGQLASNMALKVRIKKIYKNKKKHWQKKRDVVFLHFMWAFLTITIYFIRVFI